MKTLQTMPASGVIVISIIAVLFILAVILLFYVRIRYRLLESKAGGKNPESRGFRAALLTEFTEAYRQYGRDVNTPAIITDVIDRCETICDVCCFCFYAKKCAFACINQKKVVPLQPNWI